MSAVSCKNIYSFVYTTYNVYEDYQLHVQVILAEFYNLDAICLRLRHLFAFILHCSKYLKEHLIIFHM